MDPKPTAIATRALMVVSHTHWDREWYQPFQLYRLRLAKMISTLLDLMETNPDYKYFTLDGHTALVEDYLEMHPEDAPRMKALVQAGRLFMGPWYILPDEFLVGGESLIRNLMEGHRIARRFGGPMKVGHLPDQFGHIREMPQILMGFDIDTAVIWRGVGDPVHDSEFWWAAPDGTRVLALYLRHGYAQAHNLPPDLDGFLLRIARARAQLEPLATTDALLLMNGDDHAFPQACLPKLLAEANHVLPDALLVHSNLPEVMNLVQRSAAVRGVIWQTVEGEFRSGQRTPLLPGVLSARMWIKQRNHACEQLLSRWAEPFSAFALTHPSLGLQPEVTQTPASTPHPALSTRHSALSTKWTRGALRQAWKYLLQNQPHDSVCGCSVDQVHEEMRPRYDWVNQIGGQLTDRSLRAIASGIDTQNPAWPDGAKPIVVFNPVGGPRTDAVSVRLTVPRDGAIQVLDPDGNPVPHQVVPAPPSEAFSTEVTRPEMARRLERLGQPGSLAVLDEFARWLLTRAHENDTDAVLTDIVVSPGPRPESLNIDLEVAAGAGHALRTVREAMAALRDAAELGLTEIYHLRIHRTDRDEADIRFVAPNVPTHGYRTFVLAPLSETARAATPTAEPFPEALEACPEPGRRGHGAADHPSSLQRPGGNEPSDIGAPAQIPLILSPIEPKAGSGPTTPAEQTGNPFVLSLSKDGRISRRGPTISVQPTIENEFFHVSADRIDGTLTVTDKRTKQTFTGLNQFENTGDAGDEYNLAAPVNDELIIGPVEPPEIALVESGPVSQTLKIDMRLELPIGLTSDRLSRSPERIGCPVTVYVSLTPGVRRVEIRTEVENLVEDHRLRVLFPTAIRTDTSWAESHFGVAARPITAPQPAFGSYEDPVATHPQKSFVDINDGRIGLMLVNRGLPEFEAMPAPGGATVALTLLRCVGWLSRDDLSTRRGYAGPALQTPGAQCPGRHAFSYALVPHRDTWETVIAEAHAFTAPMTALAIEHNEGALPQELSFLEVEPADVIVSAIKLPEKGDGLIVRLYNPTPRALEAEVRTPHPLKLAKRVTLEERPESRLSTDGPAIRLRLRPHEIATLRLLFDHPE